MKRPILISILFLLISSVSFAWNRVGNGGGAWTCRKYTSKDFLNTEIKWIAQIDLYEAVSQYGLKVKNFPSHNYKTTVKKVSDRLLNLPGNPFAGLAPFLKNVNDLRPGSKVTYLDQELKIINDALYFAVPKKETCLDGKIRYEQIVNYDNNGFIFVQKSLFNSLSERSKAALVLHEAIYAYRRSLGDTDSLNSRRIVALAFSTLTDEQLNWHLGYLKEQTAYLYPSSYIFLIKLITDDGEIHPLWNIPIKVTGPFSESAETVSLQNHSNSDGFAYINIEGAEGFHTAAPHLSVELNDGNTYSAPLTPNGWARRLSPNIFSTNPQYSCETMSFLSSNVIHIICVRQIRN
ncbi:hypothetical protein ACLSU7_00650 [Bdellovibrio sp. HCB185ZH]|uniref:hypothetical protein n=1 Tax=Bdellovibrio sp. HCB185ZH TaxID=3394235 RepID=UPI0039A6DE48